MPEQHEESAYRRGFHHAVVAAYRLALDGGRPDDFGRWLDVVEAWREDPAAGDTPPTLRVERGGSRSASGPGGF